MMKFIFAAITVFMMSVLSGCAGKSAQEKWASTK